eukprot:48496-Pelagomonas_calceolata.AAC.1
MREDVQLIGVLLRMQRRTARKQLDQIRQISYGSASKAACCNQGSNENRSNSARKQQRQVPGRSECNA